MCLLLSRPLFDILNIWILWLRLAIPYQAPYQQWYLSLIHCVSDKLIFPLITSIKVSSFTYHIHNQKIPLPLFRLFLFFPPNTHFHSFKMMSVLLFISLRIINIYKRVQILHLYQKSNTD